MPKTQPERDSRIVLENLLLKLNIKAREWDTKRKPGGKYVRYSVAVSLETKEKMEFLYEELRKEPLVKAAI
jgi:putative lipoic acid-binding regulatory protein